MHNTLVRKSAQSRWPFARLALLWLCARLLSRGNETAAVATLAWLLSSLHLGLGNLRLLGFQSLGGLLWRLWRLWHLLAVAPGKRPLDRGAAGGRALGPDLLR